MIGSLSDADAKGAIAIPAQDRDADFTYDALERPLVVDQLDRNFFLVRADRLTPRERDYLRAMAELGPGPHRSGDVAAMLGVKVESVAPRRSQLISKA